MSVGPRNRSVHPLVLDRPDELGRLTQAVRTLIDATVTTAAPADELTAATVALQPAVEEMRSAIPIPPPPRIERAPDLDPREYTHAPFDPVVGPWNPVAAPLHSYMLDGTAKALGTYGRAYEGPPGLVHGAIIAAAFDMVLALGNSAVDRGGPTLQLCIRYRKPTRLNVECVYEAEQVRVDGRKMHTVGTLTQDGEVTAEATGLFLHVDPAKMGNFANPNAPEHVTVPCDGLVPMDAPATTHPAVVGRGAELLQLANVVRSLVLVSTMHDASVADTNRWSVLLESVAASLAANAPSEPWSRFGGWDGPFDPNALFVYDCIFGAFNPLAPPLTAAWSNGVASASGVVDRRFQGPPDSVHGGVLAAIFDQVCNVANIGAEVPGLTTELCISYQSFTRIDTPLRFVAEIESIDGQNVTTTARCIQNDIETAVATGTFRRL